MSDLIEYYTSRQSTEKALDRYQELVKERGWDIGGQDGKLHLYSLATLAFDPRTPRSEALDAFSRLYGVLRRWPGVQRGGRFAPPEAVFDVLVGVGRNFLYHSGMSLASLKYPSLEWSDSEELLPRLAFLKPMAGYPHMAVSKVLHFANPGLLPIWDWDVIWNRVMHGAFYAEYRKFCHDRGFRSSENGSVFLLEYSLWAAQYIQQRDNSFMDWFVEWINRNYSDDLTNYGVRQKLHGYYATAFEFVAIGSAYLDLYRSPD